MGQDATATLSEIEAARQRLQHDVDLLEQRVQPDDLRDRARTLATITAAGALGVLVLGGLARRRQHRRAEREHARLHADAVAEVLAEVRAGRARDTAADPSPEEITSTVALLASLAALAATIVQAISRRATG